MSILNLEFVLQDQSLRDVEQLHEFLEIWYSCIQQKFWLQFGPRGTEDFIVVDINNPMIIGGLQVKLMHSCDLWKSKQTTDNVLFIDNPRVLGSLEPTPEEPLRRRQGWSGSVSPVQNDTSQLITSV